MFSLRTLLSILVSYSSCRLAFAVLVWVAETQPAARIGSANVSDVFCGLNVAHFLNLRARPQRRAWMSKSWGATDLRLRRFEATPHREVDGRMINGAALSHVALAEWHFETHPRCDMMLVLEDDTAPTSDFDRAFRSIMEYAQANTGAWDLINLGSTNCVPSPDPAQRDDRIAIYQVRSKELMRVSIWDGMHAMIVHRRALPAFQRMRQTILQHDLRYSSYGHCDHVLALDPSLTVLVASPSIVRQTVFPSDILGGSRDFNAMIAATDARLSFAREILQDNPHLPALIAPRNASAPYVEPYYGWN